jgi:cytochrome o ubiquinol oxidase subunit III
MSAQVTVADLAAPQVTAEASGAGPAPVRIVVAYGFWIFLLSDIILFSALFATYAVLHGQTAGGPSGRELFGLRNAGIETSSLLLSSYTCRRHRRLRLDSRALRELDKG